MWLNNPQCGHKEGEKFPFYWWDNHPGKSSHTHIWTLGLIDWPGPEGQVSENPESEALKCDIVELNCYTLQASCMTCSLHRCMPSHCQLTVKSKLVFVTLCHISYHEEDLPGQCGNVAPARWSHGSRCGGQRGHSVLTIRAK